MRNSVDHNTDPRRVRYGSIGTLAAILILSIAARVQAQPLWSTLTPPSEGDIYGTAFSDAENGLAAGFVFGGGQIAAAMYRTTNGGTSWSSTLTYTGFLFGVEYADAYNAFAVGSDPGCNCGAIYQSDDRGQSWSVTHVASNATPSLNAIHFVTSQLGFAGGEDGVLLKTTNGGGSWSEVSIAAAGAFTSIHFADPDNGMAVETKPDNLLYGEKIHKTTDGGASWKGMTIPGFYPLAVHVMSPTVAIAVGSMGRAAIAKTTDGGKTWSVRYSGGTGISLLSIAFPTPYVGYVVGGRAQFGNGTQGIILHTTDGGDTWTEEITNAQTAVRSVSFPAETVGYVVGDDGLVMKTQRTAIPEPKPALNVSATEIDFGTTDLGFWGSKTLEISAHNIAGLNVESIELSDTAEAQGYSVTTSKTLPASLAAGEKLTVTVALSPKLTGTLLSNLYINSNDATAPRRAIPLRVTVEEPPQPVAVLSLDSLGFGEVAVGSRKELTLEVTGATIAGLDVDSAYVLASGGAAGEFTLRTSESLPALLGPGERLVVTVEYAPKSAGGKSALLILSTNDSAATRIEIPITASGREVAGVESVEGVSRFALRLDPNPAGSRSTLRLHLAQNEELDVKLYTIDGRLVRELFAGTVEAGERSIAIAAEDLSSGMYVCRIATREKSESVRMVIVK